MTQTATEAAEFAEKVLRVHTELGQLIRVLVGVDLRRQALVGLLRQRVVTAGPEELNDFGLFDLHDDAFLKITDV
ncbi:hypothetical protein [Streptosporangium sp. V21-05]|uniref:hypothetical protein n=1 Tax=Streptosporangium sp. V21-05 TaxID=3446115 RepID=UPI003F532B7A